MQYRVISSILAGMVYLSSLFYLPIFAADIAKGEVAQVLEEELPKTFFWRIEGGRGHSYLLGTLHVDTEGATLPNTYKAALLASDALITELLAEDVTLATVIEGAAQNPFQNLEKKLGTLRFEAVYQRLQNGFTRQQLQSFQPWAILNMLENSLMPAEYSWEFGHDYQLIQFARKHQKLRFALDNVEDHVRLLTSVPEPITIRAIDRALRYSTALKEKPKKIIAAYQVRDVERIVEFSTLRDGPTLQLYAPQDRLFWLQWNQQEILAKRNALWIPKIVEALHQYALFIAIGVGHLYGEEGIINGLRNAGFQLTPIYLP